MSRRRTAHRAEFSVRCACGNEFNTSDSHIGKQLRCRCGRVLTIARPVNEYTATAPPSVPPVTARSRERKSKAQGASAARTSKSRWPSAALWTARLAWGSLALTVFAWWMLVMKSEEWLLATLLLYGPRWPLALPLVLLVPLAVLAWPRVLQTMLPLALSALVIAWPIMG